MIAIDVQNVSKKFRLYTDKPGSVKELFTKFGRPKYEDFWAVRDVSIQIKEGTVHGLVGHNGCGKSSLLRMMAGIHTPTTGQIVTAGRISALLELGAGFHPELTGRENIYLNASILGLSRTQTDELLDRIVEFAGLQAFIDSPVKHYSSGMFVRLGFAVAVHVDPQILLVDEVIAVGDEEFQRRCLDHLRTLKAEGVTIVLVTHAMGIVQGMCDTATWMDHGRVMAEGDPLSVVGKYLHGVNDKEAERDLANDLDSFHPTTAVAPGHTSLRVEKLVLQDPDGEHVPFGISGAPLDIRVDWSTVGEFAEPRLVMHLLSSAGLHLATTYTPDGSPEPLGEGRWSALCRFDSLPLAPGAYKIQVTATDVRTNVIFHKSDEYDLTVRAEGHSIEGVFALPAQWIHGLRRGESA